MMYDDKSSFPYRQIRWVLAVGALALTGCQGPSDLGGEGDDRLIGAGFHKECTAHQQCTVLPGAGPDRCVDDAACDGVRLGCLGGACELIPGEGPDMCSFLGESDGCVGHHLECSVGEFGAKACVLVEGVGPNECHDDWDCSYNSVSCQQGECVHIPGAQAPACSDDAQCAGHHLGCDGISCVLLDGAGPNQCLVDEDCAAVTICQDGACIPIRESDGDHEGYRRCDADVDCTQFHMNCLADMCHLGAGAGDNEC
ncbi:MAG: hypothetical protein K0V04_03190, partial [Deltaproteobacteria bacterium]|nr:hypothetical protein [Deltaproteobacteria bacterium]